MFSNFRKILFEKNKFRQLSLNFIINEQITLARSKIFHGNSTTNKINSLTIITLTRL